MPKKKNIVDRFKNGTKVLECTQTESNTVVCDGRGNILFSLGETLDGAWSERRILRAMHKAYLQGLKKNV